MAHFLLIHGSCHGAWCWDYLRPELERLGHSVQAIDLPGAGADPTDRAEVTLDLYAQAVVAALREPAILVGHSMGGYPITAAAEADPSQIRALVYLCAYRPVSGLSLAQMRRLAPRQPLQGALDILGESFLFKADRAAELLAQDCSEEIQAWQIASLTPQPIRPQEEPLNVTERSRSLPQFYLRCAQDQTIPPEYQAQMAADLPPGRHRVLPASHSPFLSMPAVLAQHLSEIAAELDG